jgi:hypothetical protein
MRKRLVAVALVAMATMLFAGTASVAVPPPPTDFPPGDHIVGIYTANDGTGYAHTDPTPFVPVELYLVVSGIPEGGMVMGWELFIDLQMPASWFVLQWTLMGAALNVKDPPEFAVGVNPGMPSENGSAVLMNITLLPGSSDTAFWRFDILQSVPPSVPDEIVYVLDDPGNLVPMTPSSGSKDRAVFGFNLGPGVVMPHEERPAIPVEQSTWGGVKDLYK